MTIETSSAQGASRSAATSESKGAKGKQDDSANGSGGFMAVLASVETVQTAAPATPEASGTAKKPDASKPQGKTKAPTASEAAKADAAAGDAGVPEYAATVGDDAAKVAADDALQPSDPAAAAAAAALALLGAGADPAAGTDAPMDAAALLAQSAAWTASAKGGGTETGAGQTPTTLGANGAVAGVTAPRTTAVPTAATAGAPVPPEMSAEQLAQSLQKAAKAAGDTKSQPVQAAPTTAESQPVPDGKALAGGRKATADELQLTPSMASAVANAAAAAATLRREDQPRERSVFRSSTATDGATAPQAASTPAPIMTVSSSPEVIAPTDAFVAEKVSYWISNNVQNAELKLDGMGERAVEVSIRMQGNEAHVAFRTDELQTRAALENASVHLKDMLQREGLVLSGVSVGTAGTGDSGGQDRQPRQGARQTTVTALQPLGADLRGVSNRASSGGLDLFV